MENGIRKLESREDFKKVYQVFTEEPYNEEYTDEELDEIYDEYMEKGFMYGAYINGECSGLIAIERGVKKDQPVNYDENSTAYLADVAVLRKFRNTGLGTQLMIYGVMAAKEQGFKTMYMRTLEKGKSMSYGIAERLGFSQVPNTYQIVDRERTVEDMDTKAVNIFLDIDLENLDREKIKATMDIAKKGIARKLSREAKKDEKGNTER